jgi:hypothetical protein
MSVTVPTTADGFEDDGGLRLQQRREPQLPGIPVCGQARGNGQLLCAVRPAVRDEPGVPGGPAVAQSVGRTGVHGILRHPAPASPPSAAAGQQGVPEPGPGQQVLVGAVADVA